MIFARTWKNTCKIFDDSDKILMEKAKRILPSRTFDGLTTSITRNIEPEEEKVAIK